MCAEYGSQPQKGFYNGEMRRGVMWMDNVK